MTRSSRVATVKYVTIPLLYNMPYQNTTYMYNEQSDMYIILYCCEEEVHVDVRDGYINTSDCLEISRKLNQCTEVCANLLLNAV